jgi:hypothetical protein
MIRFYFLFLFSPLALAAPPQAMDQVDIILFTHLRTSFPLSHQQALPPGTDDALLLSNELSRDKRPYHRLAPSSSGLANAYWVLNHKPEYQVLLHYSWLQPRHKPHPVRIESRQPQAWDIEGTLHIQRGHYLFLDTAFLFSTKDMPDHSFVFQQKKRLKSNVVYYFDHPQAGMLIKVHPVS